MGRKANIDWDLQKELRKAVFIEDNFTFETIKIYYRISSEEGLVFFDDGLNKFHNYGFIKNDKGIKLFFQSWIQDPLKPSIFFIHGNAENSSSHPKFFYYLLKNNYNIFAFDQQGYGNSEGIRGTFDSFYDYIKNVDLVYSHFYKKLTFLIKGMANLKGKKKKNVELTYPEFLFTGFSMGGLEALYYIYLYNYLDSKLNLFKNIKDSNLQNYDKINGIKKVILLNPWLSHHPRLINKFGELMLKYFHFLFSKYELMRQDSQKLLLEEYKKNSYELYLKMYKNLTDNKKYLIRRSKDIRIHRLVSKFWLSDIARNQLFLKSKIKNKKFHQKYFKINPEFYLFLGSSDIIVNNSFTETLFKSSLLKYKIFWLKKSYHDFLDYDDKRWDEFISFFESALN